MLDGVTAGSCFGSRLIVHPLERACIAMRHNAWLGSQEWLWSAVRVPYNRLVRRIGRRGLPRVINGTDEVLVSPCYRGVSEKYEADVWHHLMSQVRAGDVIADVGAFIGLYSVALARRIGPNGRLVAFEPDPYSAAALAEHCRLNHVADRVAVVQAAVGNADCRVSFYGSAGLESHVRDSANSPSTVDCVQLDSVFKDQRVDIVKIDVEGYEERVLQGATQLLGDRGRRPRAIYVEVHPYAWPAVGSSGESILGLLHTFGYNVSDPIGHSMSSIDAYGEIVATPRASA